MISRSDSQVSVPGVNDKCFFMIIILSLLLYSCKSTPADTQIVFTDTANLIKYGDEMIADAKKAFEERAAKGDTIRLANEKLIEYLPKHIKNCAKDGNPVIVKTQFYNKVGQNFRYKHHRFMVEVADYNNEFALFEADIIFATKALAFAGSTETRKAVQVGNHKGLFLYQKSNIGTWGSCSFWVDNRFSITVNVELPENEEALEEILSLIDFSKMPRFN